MNMKKYLFAIVALGMLAAYAYIKKLTSKEIQPWRWSSGQPASPSGLCGTISKHKDQPALPKKVRINPLRKQRDLTL